MCIRDRSSIEVWLKENGIERKLCFSGDVGNLNQTLIRNPKQTAQADYVIMESTYGDRLHETACPDYVKDLAGLLQETFDPVSYTHLDVYKRQFRKRRERRAS